MEKMEDGLVYVKIKSENMEVKIEHFPDVMGTETTNRNIQKDITDQIKHERRDGNGLENVCTETKVPNKEENQEQDVPVIIKTEIMEEDGYEHVLGSENFWVKIGMEKMDDEFVCVKKNTENTEDRLKHVFDQIENESRNWNGLENVWTETEVPNKEGNLEQDVPVVMKTEKMEEDQSYEHGLGKTKSTDTENSGEIDSAAIPVKVEFDLAEKIVVMNENTKFRDRVKPDTSTYMHLCLKCDIAFKLPHHLKNHINFVHKGDSPYMCKVCGKQFINSNSLKMHKYVHTEERPHRCKVCQSSFKIRAALNKHMHFMHGKNELKFKCEHCSKVFKRKDQLVRHFVVHQNEYKFACEVCGKALKHKGSLKKHLLIHSDEKKFDSQECGMKFGPKEGLTVHRMDLEVKPYKCDFCDKSFSRTHDLQRHLPLHTRPYKCQYCDKSFTRRINLQIHEKMHRGEKDFECEVCGKAFVQRCSLTLHMRVHTNERPYKCKLCPYKAKSSGALKDHMTVHTEERPLQCDVCPYKAKRHAALWAHKKKHEMKRKKELEADRMSENGTDFEMESMTEDGEAMRENLNEDT